MNKIVKWFSPVMFCLFIFSFALTLIFLPDQEYSEKEKRYLDTAPRVTWEAVLDGSFQDQLESWIADQFPLRDFWVGLHAYSQLILGKNAHQDIYAAEDGYLINAPATQDLTDFRNSISRFDRFVEKTGLPASLLMVPSTGWLHEDSLPSGHEPYPDDLMFLEASEIVQYIYVLDVRDVLKEADHEKSVAYRTDHHLTSYGNYVLYSFYQDYQERAYFPQSHYVIETIPGFYGTTWSGSGYWLTKSDDLEIWDSSTDTVTVSITDGDGTDMVSDSMFFREHLEELDKYPVFLDGNHALTTIQNPDAKGGTLLIIKDSYAHGFAPFLAENYQTIYLLDLRYYRGKISDFAAENGVDELLFLYGTSTLLTDTNSAWLF